MEPIQQHAQEMENGNQIHRMDIVSFHQVSIIVCVGNMYIRYYAHNYVAKCGPPMIDSVVEVVIHDTEGLRADIGTTVNFTCPPDLSLEGISSTTCTENGEWTPDPSGVMCTKG